MLAMKAAFQRAGLVPQDVDYVECHATGTAKGDPVEANWIGQAFHRGPGSELLIGSVKGNIG
jgi:acyl transferase domain-containing protein